MSVNLLTILQGRRIRAALLTVALVLSGLAAHAETDWARLHWVDRSTGQRVDLADFAGHIVVLDYFAHWCAPCARSSREIETGITRYYAKTPQAAGVPVTVLAVNVEKTHPDRTNAFLRRAGVEHAVDDPKGRTLEEFDARSLPFIVVLDGSAGGWRLVYSKNGFDGVTTLRDVIDAVGQPEAEE